MNIRNLFLTAALFFISSCSSSANPSLTMVDAGLISHRTIDIDGAIRTYDLFLPENQENSPVIIMLHGHGSNSEQILGGSGNRAPYKVWLDIAAQNNLVLAVPNGVVGPDGKTGWNDCRTDSVGNPTIDDVAFITQMVDLVEKGYSIDRKRIYVIGTSNGGHMAIRLAQEAPQLIASIAVVAALMPVNSACDENETPISALFINGTNDPIAPYKGGQMLGKRGEILSSEDTIDYWVRRNSLTTTPEITLLPDIDTGDKSTAEKTHYTGGKTGAEFVHLKIVGGGHTEPSIAQEYRAGVEILLGKQNHDVEMADEVWAFFKSIAKP